MKIKKQNFGLLSNGKKAYLYTLQAGDIRLSLTNWGGHWVSLYVPQKKGPLDDVILGFSTLDAYTKNDNYFGATVGRYCNRIGGGKFKLEGKDYQLYLNDGKNTLHGGRRGFNQRLWKAEMYDDKDGVYVRLSLDSPDGEEGYPGNLNVAVSYGLTRSNEIVVLYEAKSDMATPVNLTNHSFYNLAGEGSGTILNHELKINASGYLDVDKDLIPTGKVLPTEGTAWDFSASKSFARDIAKTGIGYDHCFVLNGEAGELRPCVDVLEPTTGRKIHMFTTKPAVQIYSGNFLDGVQGKAGSVYNKHEGFAMETQYHPDNINKPQFPQSIVSPGHPYREKTVLAFDW
jgi:aldose 1-epimerase